MKKLIFTFLTVFLAFFSLNALAEKDTPINVNIVKINANPSGYYCLNVFVGYDMEKGCHIPTRIGSGWINRYLIGITKEEKGYLQFAYSSPQSIVKNKLHTNWLCTIPLNKSGKINVTINSSSCKYTYQ